MNNEQRKKLVYENTPIDRIIEIIDLGDCFEVIGTAGGDTLTYRFYNDGTKVER